MNDKEYKTLKKVVSLYECNVCQHEEVHRGGSIWTICSNCDMKWADDMGGFKPYTVPTPIVDAYLLISEHEQDQMVSVIPNIEELKKFSKKSFRFMSFNDKVKYIANEITYRNEQSISHLNTCEFDNIQELKIFENFLLKKGYKVYSYEYDKQLEISWDL